MIYSILLFQTETFNSYQLCEKVFASDWKSQLVYSLLIILRSMIKQSESIKMLNANSESTVIICRIIELNEYLWLSSVTMSIHSWSSQWFLSTSIKNFTFEWVSIQIQLTMKSLMNELKLKKQMMLSFEWKSYWTSIINNWKKLSWSSKLLWLYSEDSLSEQHSESLRSITIKDDEHWEINDILNFRCYRDRIQYKVKWKDLDRNNE